MSRLKSFIDTGVLIAAARGNQETSQKAIQVLDDPNRDYASSIFIKLEILPKPVYNHREDEIEFYNEYFNSVRYWADVSENLANEALRIGKAFGLGGMDSLHVAAALSIGADELIAIESLTKPIHRVTEIRVVTLRNPNQ